MRCGGNVGWSSGSELFSKLIKSVKSHVDDKSIREKIYKDMIEEFESFDCDNLEECQGEDPAFNKAWKSYLKLNHRS